LVAAPLIGAGVAHAARSNTPLTSEEVLEQETSLGDLVADCIRQAGSADAALVNATQFKPGTIPAGKVTPGDVSALLVKPARPWSVSNVTGTCLKAALERSLSRAPAQSAHFLQVSGLHVVFDTNLPAGARVTDLRVGGKPVQDSAVYRVAMPEDLAKGGSGYFTIPCFSEANISPNPAGTLTEAITAFLDAHPTLNYADLNRIVPRKP